MSALLNYFSQFLWLSLLVSHSQARWRLLLSISSQIVWAMDSQRSEKSNEPFCMVYRWSSLEFKYFEFGSRTIPILTWVVTLWMDSVKTDWSQSRIFTNQLLWGRRRVYSWCCSCYCGLVSEECDLELVKEGCDYVRINFLIFAFSTALAKTIPRNILIEHVIQLIALCLMCFLYPFGGLVWKYLPLGHVGIILNFPVTMV